MAFLSGPDTGMTNLGSFLDPGVTSIDQGGKTPDRGGNKTLSRAVALHLEGKREAAARMLSRAIEAGERDPALYAALGHVQFELRDYEHAAANYRALSELEPNHKTAHYNLGVCLGNAQQWKLAADAFRKALAVDATRVDAHLGLGIAQIRAGSPAQAQESLDRYLGLFPDHEPAMFARAVALQQLGRHGEAVEQYRKVLVRNPRSEEALSNLVALFLDRRDGESVRRYAAMLAELRPGSGVALEALATLAFADEDYPAAARYARELVTAMPSRYENWFNLGVAHHQMGDLERAAEAYTQATVLNPSSAPAYLNLGVIRQELGELGEARDCYEKSLTLEPDQPSAMWNLALVLEQLNERQRAETLYGQVPDRAFEWCDAQFRLGYLRLLRGDYRGSAEAFQAVLAKQPNWAEACLNAGIAFARAGDPAKARQYFTETVMLRPDSSDGVRGLAALALEQNEYEEALELHERLIEMGERSPEVFYNAGLICQKRGQFADAVSFYQQAIDVDPQFAEALLNMGHAQMALGAEDQALASWRRAIKEKPSLADSYFEPVDPHA